MANSSVQDPVDLKTFIEYLKQQQRKGETHIHLDEQAKLILREFYFRAKGIKKPSPQAAAQTAPSSPPPTAQKASPAAPTVKDDSPTAETAPATKVAAQGATPEAKIESLKAQARTSAEIQGLKTLHNTLVFSAGNPNADIMFVGEAPGYHEEKQEKPFAGPAGQKLDGILRAMGLSREQVYLTYLVKFRPKMENQTTNNRKPTEKEINACTPYLKQEIVTVKPKVMVTLGALPAEIMLGTKKPINQLRVENHQIAGITTRVTYNPSYLLANDSNSDKRMVWEDMLNVMRDLEMPISDKQQNYFT